MKKLVIILIFLLLISGLSIAETRYSSFRHANSIMSEYRNTYIYDWHTACDPFVLTISGTKYYMLIDNGSGYNYTSLLGCNNPNKKSMHEPLMALNSDNDKTKLTPTELEKAKIRFVQLKSNGKLAVNENYLDYNLDNIGYIDLMHLRVSPEQKPYGNFDIYIKNESGSLRKNIAKVSALSIQKAEDMF